MKKNSNEIWFLNIFYTKLQHSLMPASLSTLSISGTCFYIPHGYFGWLRHWEMNPILVDQSHYKLNKIGTSEDLDLINVWQWEQLVMDQYWLVNLYSRWLTWNKIGLITFEMKLPYPKKKPSLITFCKCGFVPKRIFQCYLANLRLFPVLQNQNTVVWSTGAGEYEVFTYAEGK